VHWPTKEAHESSKPHKIDNFEAITVVDSWDGWGYHY